MPAPSPEFPLVPCDPAGRGHSRTARDPTHDAPGRRAHTPTLATGGDALVLSRNQSADNSDSILRPAFILSSSSSATGRSHSSCSLALAATANTCSTACSNSMSVSLGRCYTRGMGRRGQDRSQCLLQQRACELARRHTDSALADRCRHLVERPCFACRQGNPPVYDCTLSGRPPSRGDQCAGQMQLNLSHRWMTQRRRGSLRPHSCTETGRHFVRFNFRIGRPRIFDSIVDLDLRRHTYPPPVAWSNSVSL